MERPCRILLLEDEPLLRRSLTVFLAAQGYRVVAAASPEDGGSLLHTLGWTWPDMVISDVNLCRDPDIPLGYVFHAWWRSRFPLPPFVFMVGSSRFPCPEKEARFGVRHILKPFAPSELLLLLRSIVA